MLVGEITARSKSDGCGDASNSIFTVLALSKDGLAPAEIFKTSLKNVCCMLVGCLVGSGAR